jgi:hypothetical protein
MPMFKIPPPLEKDEEQMCIDLYEQVGLIVIKTSQPQKPRGMTKGIADLQILDPKREAFWWHEVKRRSGPEYKKVNSEQTADQRWFQLAVESTGQRYILGPLSTARDELVERGILK